MNAGDVHPPMEQLARPGDGFVMLVWTDFFSTHVCCSPLHLVR